MGNEIYYCIGCGSRVSGPDFGGDRSHCARCLGLPMDATPRPGRDSSKRIRKPSSGAITAVAVRPRPPMTTSSRPSRAVLMGGLALAGAALFALGTLFAPAREKTTSLISQPPQALEKTTSLISQPAAPQELEKSSSLFSQEVEKTTSLKSQEVEKTTSLISQATAQVELEAKADYFHDVIQEAASALADEGRFEDALARIRAFPPQYRNTRAWNSLEGLRRQIEARARSK